MSKPSKFLLFLIFIALAAVVGAAVLVRSVDSGKLRAYVVDTLSEKTGRKVKLNGAVAVSLGLDGIKVSAQNVSIANADWASRPVMAIIGKFDLGISPLYLLSGRILVNNLVMENADINMEVDASGRRNWDMREKASVSSSDGNGKSDGKGVSLSVDKLSILNGHLSVRNADGKTDNYNITALDLRMRRSGAEASFKGDKDGLSINAKIKADIVDLFSRDAFAFSMDGLVSSYRVYAQGVLDLNARKAEIENCSIASGRSEINGALSVSWGDGRTAAKGNFSGGAVALSDFASSAEETEGVIGGGVSVIGTDVHADKVFSDAKLPIEALRAVDLSFDLGVERLMVGRGALNKVSAKLVSSNGITTFSPLRASIGDVPVEIKAKLNYARSPAMAEFSLNADGVDIGELQKLFGSPAFMSGKSGINISVAGEGDSAHKIASTLHGVISVVAGKGNIFTGAAAKVSSYIAVLFGGSGQDDALSCLAARFIVRNGVVADNGILIDSAASTVLGGGSINLGNETINVSLRAKTKLVDVGGLLPPLRIGGSLVKPEYSVDAVGAVQNVINSLSGGSLAIIGSGVPDLQVDPAGQNACVYTLEHPKKEIEPTLSPGTALDQAGKRIMNIGSSILGGVLGGR